MYLDGEDSVGEVDGVPGQVEEVVDHTNEGVDVGLEVALRQHERVLELGAVYHTKISQDPTMKAKFEAWASNCPKAWRGGG